MQRTSVASEANLVMESVAWEHHVDLKMPFKKKKVSVDWQASELPTIPVLINKKPLKEHTCLAVHWVDKNDKANN